MQAEQKLRQLAIASAPLQAIFGSPLFRWNMFGQLEQGYIERGTCARIKRVSTVSTYCQDGPLAWEQIRFQFDFMDLDPMLVGPAADAVAAWFQTVDLMSDQQFVSPPGTVRQFPNFSLNQRTGIEAQPGKQIYIMSVDWKVFNNPNV